MLIVGAAGDRGRDLRIVTEYELEVETRLLIAERAHSVDAAVRGPLPDRLLSSVLETLVSYLLIESESTRLELVSVSAADVDAERATIEGRIGGEGSIEQLRQALDAPEDLVEDILRRRALVNLFVRRNIQLAGPVSDVDVEEAYRSGDHPFGNRPLEEIRPSIEAYLNARAQREGLEQWLDETRRRSRVWIVPP